MGEIPPDSKPLGGEKLPPEIPPVPGGILEFRGGLGGDCQNLKITGLPPGTGGDSCIVQGGFITQPAAGGKFWHYYAQQTPWK